MPLNCSALPYLPVVAQVVFETVPVLPLPDASVTVVPDPSSNPYAATRPDGPVAAAQVTATLVTLAEPIVPEPFETEQVCPDGFVFTVTAYAAPDANLVANVNGPFALTLRSSPPLSCNTTVPDNPDTDPPTEYVGVVVQVTATLVTLAEPIVP